MKDKPPGSPFRMTARALSLLSPKKAVAMNPQPSSERDGVDCSADGTLQPLKPATPSWLVAFVVTLLVALFAAALIKAIYNWKNELGFIAIATIFSILVPSTLYLPCLLFHWVRLRSFSKARRAAWENWKVVGTAVANLFSQLH